MSSGEHPTHVDVVVIGGGMAGVSVAHELAASRSVALVEVADTLGTQSTGRSAAAWIASYGPDAVRRLTLASRPFLDDPDVPVHGPLLTPIPYVVIGLAGEAALVDGDHASLSLLPGLAEHLERLDGREAETRVPVLRPGCVEAALVDHSAQSVDVAGLLQGYAVSARERGAHLLVGSGVVGLASVGGAWEAHLADGSRLIAPTVINAAGAWGDEVAALADIAPVGLEPRRRSVFVVAAPAEIPAGQLPLLNTVSATWYLKPESGQVLCSPEDATPHSPGDPRPDELEIARAIDDINEVTTLAIRSVRTTWAGLRTFAPDGLPVVGEDPGHPGFHWLVGQGGYGIQMAPALARLAAALVTGAAVPADLAALGIDPDTFAPGRLRA